LEREYCFGGDGKQFNTVTKEAGLQETEDQLLCAVEILTEMSKLNRVMTLPGPSCAVHGVPAHFFYRFRITETVLSYNGKHLSWNEDFEGLKEPEERTHSWSPLAFYSRSIII